MINYTMSFYAIEVINGALDKDDEYATTLKLNVSFAISKCSCGFELQMVQYVSEDTLATSKKVL